jgi:tyrosyl-tRNA synthetase
MSIRRLQFFMRTSDSDVEKYLNLFTLLPVEEISSVVRDHQVAFLRSFPRCDFDPC